MSIIQIIMLIISAIEVFAKILEVLKSNENTTKEDRELVTRAVNKIETFKWDLRSLTPSEEVQAP